MSNSYFTDCVGNRIIEGDLVRMYHFTGSRNKKNFMYKIALRYEIGARGLLFLSLKDVHSEHNFRIREGDDASRYLMNMVVVSRKKFHNSELDNLKRSKHLRD